MFGIKELIVFIGLVGLICWLVVKPMDQIEPPKHMSLEMYEELDDLEQHLINEAGANSVYRYEKLIIRKYRYEQYDLIDHIAIKKFGQ